MSDIEQRAKRRANILKEGTTIQFTLSEDDIVACRTPEYGSRGFELLVYIAQHDLWDFLVCTSDGRKVDCLKDVYKHPDYVAWRSTKGARG